MNKHFFFLLAVAGLLASCKKDRPQGISEPEYHSVYTPLFRDSVFNAQHKPALDIDGDGQADFIAVTELIADAAGDHLHYAVAPLNGNAIRVENNAAAPFNRTMIIGSSGDDSRWKTAKAMLLVKTVRGNGDVAWKGPWIDAAKQQYLGVCLRKEGRQYYGWIEVQYTLSPQEPRDHFIFRKAAVSTIAQQSMYAGLR